MVFQYISIFMGCFMGSCMVHFIREMQSGYKMNHQMNPLLGSYIQCFFALCFALFLWKPTLQGDYRNDYKNKFTYGLGIFFTKLVKWIHFTMCLLKNPSSDALHFSYGNTYKSGYKINPLYYESFEKSL